MKNIPDQQTRQCNVCEEETSVIKKRIDFIGGQFEDLICSKCNISFHLSGDDKNLSEEEFSYLIEGLKDIAKNK